MKSTAKMLGKESFEAKGKIGSMQFAEWQIMQDIITQLNLNQTPERVVDDIMKIGRIQNKIFTNVADQYFEQCNGTPYINNSLYYFYPPTNLNEEDKAAFEGLTPRERKQFWSLQKRKEGK